MLLLLQFITVLILLGAFLFFSPPQRIWIPLLAVSLLCASVLALVHLWLLVSLWFIYSIILIFLLIAPLRYHCMTKPLLAYLRRALPGISQSEQEALEVGDVWFEGELFCGRPQWQQYLSKSVPCLSAEEQAFLDQEVETLCQLIDDWQINQAGEISVPVWQYIKAHGFLGLVIGRQYGGKGFSPQAHSAIITKIASRSISVAFSVMVPNSVGPADLLSRHGTEAQKAYYLPRLARGEEIPCFALTAPEAGSDAAAIPDTGIVCQQLYEGKQTLGVRLNWNKRYITLAPIATLVGVAFHLYDPEHLLGDQEALGITLALVPAKHPGVETGKRHRAMNLGFMNGPTRGKNVFIPLDWLIGGVSMAGQGWRMLMAALSGGRAISLLALASANGKVCYRTSGAYARLRKQFNRPIACFEGIEAPLARIGGYTYLLEALRLITAAAVAQDLCPALASAMAKYHSTEMARYCINDAMDIHGGRSIQFGPRNYLGLLYQATPVSITVEGANILTRSLMIFGQGVMRCHPYLHAEIAQATQSDDRAVKRFDQLLLSHMAYLLQNAVRCFTFAVTAGLFIRTPKIDYAGKYLRALTRMSVAFAFVADVAIILLGNKLKRRENLSARLGDVLSQLYLGSAAVKYFKDNGCSAEELPYLHWTLQTSLYRAQQAFTDFFANFPLPIPARLLRFIVFPWGRRYRKPDDNLVHQLAETMLQPSPLRDRISQYCYVNNDNNDPIGRVEDALHKVISTVPVKKKLQQAITDGKISQDACLDEQIQQSLQGGILTQKEAWQLQAAEKARQDAMQVDEF